MLLLFAQMLPFLPMSLGRRRTVVPLHGAQNPGVAAPNFSGSAVERPVR